MTLKKITHAIAVAALFLVPIFPLIVANSLFFPFITGKAFYFRLLVELAFSSWVILACLDAKYRPKITPLTIGLTVFALVTLAADLLGVNPIRSLWSNFERMEGWITIIHLWMFFIAATSIFGNGEEGRKWWHRFLNTELVVALVVGGYGLVQLFGWAPIHQGSSRIDASLGNAAYMAVYMLLNAGVAAYLFLVSRKEKTSASTYLQWVYGILFLLFSFLMFETETRGTILGWIGGVLLALLLYSIFAKNDAKIYRKWAAGILIAIVILGGAFWFLRSQPFVQNNDVLSRMANISLNDSETTARFYIWGMALKGFEQRPVLGWGQENFNYIFNANYNPALWSQEQWFDRAHSVYLDWLSASGIVGLIAYLALYVLFLMAIWKSVSLSVAEKSVLTGLLAGYAIHNIFVFDNLASYVLFAALLGFAASHSEGKPLSWLGGGSLSTDAVEYIVAPAMIIVLVFNVYFFNIRPLQENTRLISALESCDSSQPDPSLFQNALNVGVYVGDQEIREQILSCAGSVISGQAPDPTKQAFFTLGLSAIQDQIAATPKDARIYTLGGSFLTSIGQFSQAEPLLQIAHTLSPGKQTIDFELATDYLNVGSTTAAVDLLKQAYESAPDYQQAQTAYAIALVFNGQEAYAEQLFNNDPAIFETAQMAEVYGSLKEYQKAIAIYQSIIAADPTDVNTVMELAQTQYEAGMTSAAIATMRSVEKTNPEYTDQIESTIKQIQAQK